MRPVSIARVLTFAVLTSAASSDAFGDLSPGDLLINDFSGSVRRIRLSDFSTQTFSDGGATGTWEGASLSPLGRVMTTFRTPAPGVKIFNPDGSVAFSFATPELAGAGDLSAFKDGTIAISDQSGHVVDFYSPSGTFLWSSANLGSVPFGNDVAPDGTLWVAAQNKIFHLGEDGSTLGSITAPYGAFDLVTDPAGTLWVTSIASQQGNPIQHLAPDGTLLGSFSGGGRQIAIANDGSLYVDGGNNPGFLFHFSSSGSLLNNFVLSGTPLFMTVVPEAVPEPATLAILGFGLTILIARSRRIPA